MRDPLLMAWAQAFTVTCVTEGLVVAICLRHLGRWRVLGAAFFAQLLSHPSVWMIFPRLNLPYNTYFAMAEVFAVVVEALFYAFCLTRLSLRRAFGVSLLANVVSVGVGLLGRKLGVL